MPAKVALRRGGQADRSAAEEARRARPRRISPTATLDARTARTASASQSDGKAEYVYLHSLAKGQPLARGLQEALDDALAKLPIPKVMSYAGAGSYYNDVKFVRPAHRLLALHGADVVPVDALGLAAGRTTDGHRFLSRRDIDVATADAYEETLRAEGKVIASFAERRAAIVDGARQAPPPAPTVIMPDALLDEVTALVEWPAVYAGTFDPAFLAVPQECLILTMQQNQKYFALADAAGKLVHRFLVVSNIETARPRGDRPGQRARAARAARRRAVLLRPGPQGRGSRRASPRLAQRRLSQQARHAGRARRRACAARRRRSRAPIGADAAARRPRRAARQGRSRHRHGRRVSRSCRA